MLRCLRQDGESECVGCLAAAMRGSGSRHAVLAEFPQQRLSMDAENDGRSAYIMLMRIQHPQDVVPLQMLQRHPSLIARERFRRRVLDGRRKIFRTDHGMRTQGNGSLNRMFEFPNVARPPVSAQQFHGLRGDILHRWRFYRPVQVEEPLGQGRNVLPCVGGRASKASRPVCCANCCRLRR